MEDSDHPSAELTGSEPFTDEQVRALYPALSAKTELVLIDVRWSEAGDGVMLKREPDGWYILR